MKYLNLFIDTNIFLNFYHFSSDDIDRLKELTALVNETKEIRLFIPSQVVDEFNRNRENKISDALKKFSSSIATIPIPNMVLAYDEGKQLKSSNETNLKLKEDLTKKLFEDIKNKTLAADQLIQKLFQNKIEIESSDFKNAKIRFELGNPPGKNKSIGDAINWEFLLRTIPTKEDIHLIAFDKDYSSSLDLDLFSFFLQEEWNGKKESQVVYYRSLSSFIRTNFPKIKLTDEYIKERKIELFAESLSFDVARKRLKELVSRYSDFTDEQIKKIVKASIQNDQIYNAHKYSPELIGNQLFLILKGRESLIDPKDLQDFYSKFSNEHPADECVYCRSGEVEVGEMCPMCHNVFMG